MGYGWTRKERTQYEGVSRGGSGEAAARGPQKSEKNQGRLGNDVPWICQRTQRTSGQKKMRKERGVRARRRPRCDRFSGTKNTKKRNKRKEGGRAKRGNIDLRTKKDVPKVRLKGRRYTGAGKSLKKRSTGMTGENKKDEPIKNSTFHVSNERETKTATKEPDRTNHGP